MAKTAALSLRIEPALKDALEKAAVADSRPLANYVEKVLTEHIANKIIAARRRPSMIGRDEDGPDHET